MYIIITLWFHDTGSICYNIVLLYASISGTVYAVRTQCIRRESKNIIMMGVHRVVWPRKSVIRLYVCMFICLYVYVCVVYIIWFLERCSHCSKEDVIRNELFLQLNTCYQCSSVYGYYGSIRNNFLKTLCQSKLINYYVWVPITYSVHAFSITRVYDKWDEIGLVRSVKKPRYSFTVKYL